MDKGDYKAFCKLWLGHCGGRQGRVPSDEALMMIYGDLEYLPFEVVREGLVACARRSPFMPTPADVIAGAFGTPEDNAIAAWRIVSKAIKTYGEDKSIRFTDPCAMWAIETMGGWRSLCATNEKYAPQDFMKYYVAAMNLGPRRERPADHLIGREEANANEYAPWCASQIITIAGYEDGRLLTKAPEHDSVPMLPAKEKPRQSKEQFAKGLAMLKARLVDKMARGK